MGRQDRTLRGAAAIVGVADDVSPTGELERTGRELEVAMVLEALEDAGLTLADVDGVCHPESAVAFAEYLGIHPVFTESTMTGGSSYEVHVEHAAAAIAAGVCDVVVSVYAATPRSDRTRNRPARTPRLRRAEPDGRVGHALRPADAHGSLRIGGGAPHARLRHHLRAAGADRGEHPAVGGHEPAGALPRTADHRRRAGLAAAGQSVAPARLLPRHRRCGRVRHDERGAARTLRKAPVVVLGAATCTNHMGITQMPDLTTTPGVVSGANAFGMAGMKPDDVDVLMGYDSFTITALLHLEDLGFCQKGEGGSFVADGHLGPGGTLAMNTNGGGLSFTHPGMYGMFLLTEATRQLRGECGERQVDGATVAVAHGSGMFLSVMSTVVLGREAAL